MKTIEETQDHVYNGKWEDLMPTIPNGSIDLIITSPPYNVNLGNNKHKKDSYDSYDDNMPYGDYLSWMEQLFYACNRVLKRGGRLCINIGDGANGSIPTHADFTNLLTRVDDGIGFKKKNTYPLQYTDGEELQYYSDINKEWRISVDNEDGIEPFEMMTTIVWDKNQIGASTAWGSWQSPSQPSFPTQFEFIIVVGKGTTKHTGDKEKITVSGDNFIRNSRALWTFPPETKMMKEYDHPAMFPEELPRRLMDQLTYREDVVLDPFSGAGTTCATAKKMGRHYIGFEMSEKYHNKALDRLSLIPELDHTRDVCLPKWMK